MRQKSWVVPAFLLLILFLIFSLGCVPKPTVKPPTSPTPTPTPITPTAKPTPKPKKITLYAVTAWPATVRESKNFLEFVEIVNAGAKAKHPGELEIKYRGGPEAVPTASQGEAIRTGIVDMVFTTTSYYTGLVPEAEAAKLTQFHPWEERARGFNDFFNKLHESKMNSFYLGRLGEDIPFQLYLNVKVSRPQDLKGLKIRVSPKYRAFMKALGATPVVIPPGDVYTALERHVVDGYVWPAVGIRDWGWEAVTKYIVGPGFYNVDNVILINLDTWKSLPAHLQKLLLDSMVEAEHKIVAKMQSLLEKERPILVSKGLKVIEFSPADAKWYLDTAYSAGWDEIMSKCPEYGPKLKEFLTKK